MNRWLMLLLGSFIVFLIPIVLFFGLNLLAYLESVSRWYYLAGIAIIYYVIKNLGEKGNERT
jgi:hypothetical protein